MANFTPGPWSRGFSDGGVAFINARGVCVARLDDGNIEDNAHLIACAPAMYEALKAIVEYEANPDFTLWAKRIDAARAVLAQANGETKRPHRKSKLAAASTRSEADVRAAKVIPLPVAVDTFTPLLEAKVRTQETYNEAVKFSARYTSTDAPDDRIAADIAKRIAYEALDIAEMSYNEAIKEHVARLREARNASA